MWWYVLGIELGFCFWDWSACFWQPNSRSASLVKCDFLLEAEKVVGEVGQFVFRDEELDDLRVF